MDSEHARSLFLIGIVGVGMLGCGQRPHHGAQSATWTAAAGATATLSSGVSTSENNQLTSTDELTSLQAGSASPASTQRVNSLSTPRRGTSSAPKVPAVRDAFVDFGANTTVSDVAAEPEAELMYVVEANGVLRVLDTSGELPLLVRAFSLFPEQLGAGRGLGALELVQPDLALLPTQGAGFEGVAIFDPSTARSSDDVTWFDVGALSATWPAGARNSQGVDVGERPLLLTDVTGVTLVGDTVFLCAANTDAEGDHNPGVVLALRLDRQQQRLEPRALIRTTAFNPTGLTRFGSLLFVTNTGSFGQTGASIDVIDVQSAKRLSSITFPELLADGRVPDPFGPVVVEPSGRSGYVGSLQQARLYALDLQALTFREDFTLPSDSTRNSTRGLALSSDGTKVFAANAGDSAVNVLDVEQKQVTQVSGLRPASEGQVEAFVVKPAPDGKGDTVLAVVGDVPVQDRAKPEVSATLDRVTLQ